MSKEYKREHVANKIVDLEEIVTSIKEETKNKIDENAAKVIFNEYMELKKVLSEDEAELLINKVLKEYDLMTESDVKNIIKEYKLATIKWVIATSVSTITITLAIMRFFLMS